MTSDPHSVASPRHSLRLVALLGLVTVLLAGLGGALAVPAIDLGRPGTDDAPTAGAGPATEPATASAPAPAAAPLDLKTGDTVDAAQLEAFQARVAWLQSQGLHKGAAVYVHG